MQLISIHCWFAIVMKQYTFLNCHNWLQFQPNWSTYINMYCFLVIPSRLSTWEIEKRNKYFILHPAGVHLSYTVKSRLENFSIEIPSDQDITYTCTIIQLPFLPIILTLPHIIPHILLFQKIYIIWFFWNTSHNSNIYRGVSVSLQYKYESWCTWRKILDRNLEIALNEIKIRKSFFLPRFQTDKFKIFS